MGIIGLENRARVKPKGSIPLLSAAFGLSYG
jgi:hypothetical protein